MPNVYILRFVKDWGSYKEGQFRITESKTTRDALVDNHKVAVELSGDEMPQVVQSPRPATPLRTSRDIGQPNPEKSPNLAKPGPKGETISHEIAPPLSRRRGR